MRVTVFALAAGFAAAACAHTETAPPTSPDAALEAFYDHYEAELPQRPLGVETAPDSVSRIALGSCMGQTAPAPALRALAASEPDLIVMLGDNVYGDAYSGDMTLPELRQAYADLAENPDFLAANAAAPILPVWDDHDYGMNDAGASFSGRRYAQRIFNAYWRVPEDDPRQSRPGVYHSEIFGPPGREVHVILLDTRYFRSPLRPSDDPGAPGRERYAPDDDPALTMLGAEQWAWLREELARPAAVKILVSSVQVIADGHGWERWGNFPLERERLYDAIRDIAPPGLIMVSGDRHRAGLYRLDDVVGYPLYEVTASSFNRSYPNDEEAGPHRVGPTFVGENFALIDIDWEAGALSVSVRDNEGGLSTVPVLAIDLADMGGR